VLQTIMSPLYTVVSWIVVQFHAAYSLVFAPNSGWAWGLAIVSLVVLIRICLIPLFVKQIKAMRSMQALQPKMKVIQERYKNDKQRQSEEMMKLYRESGTNPLSSCLPILIQSPFLFALYGVLHDIASGKTVGVIHSGLLGSAREAHIFGAPLPAKFLDSQAKLNDLSATVTDVRVVTLIMIALMSLSQFYTQRQLMTKNVDMSVKTPFMQQQKMLMYVYPVFFFGIGLFAPVGVLVYWLTTNVWTMGQQMVVIRRNPTPGSLAYKERQERLKAKGKLAEEPAKTTRTAEGGQPVRRQQPKRQTKAQRQHGGPAQQPQQAKDAAASEPQPQGSTASSGSSGSSGAGGSQKGKSAAKNPSKSQAKNAAKAGTGAEPEDAKPAGGSNGSGGARPARSGQPKAGPQRKGPQRSKHPSKK
jgi:YidC/Oxa1 family membrane protein insertase